MLEVGNRAVSKQNLKYLDFGNEQFSKNFDVERAGVMIKGGHHYQSSVPGMGGWKAGALRLHLANPVANPELPKSTTKQCPYSASILF